MTAHKQSSSIKHSENKVFYFHAQNSFKAPFKSLYLIKSKILTDKCYNLIFLVPIVRWLTDEVDVHFKKTFTERTVKLKKQKNNAQLIVSYMDFK
jgi:hypothetical protein